MSFVAAEVTTVRPTANDISNVYVASATVVSNEKRIVPDAAVLSYPIIVPVVPPCTTIVWRSPAPVLTTVVVAVDM